MLHPHGGPLPTCSPTGALRPWALPAATRRSTSAPTAAAPTSSAPRLAVPSKAGLLQSYASFCLAFTLVMGALMFILMSLRQGHAIDDCKMTVCSSSGLIVCHHSSNLLTRLVYMKSCIFWHDICPL